jgi:asparagine synthetase B (glutamine-hydrolysing)
MAGTSVDRETYAAYMAQALYHRGPDAHGIRSWHEGIVNFIASRAKCSDGGLLP